MALTATQPIRVYADTSVYGGVFDPEFDVASLGFFDGVREGRFRLVVSAIVIDEIGPAPEAVHALLDEMLGMSEIADITDEAVALQQAYLDNGIVTPKSAGDALHVALATVAGCALIVSWNFHHIVHYQKIPLYNAVNTLYRRQALDIRSPLEVVAYGNED